MAAAAPIIPIDRRVIDMKVDETGTVLIVDTRLVEKE
jgi:hypothetical protein